MSRVVSEPALVLRARPYRETSAIVDLLTLHHGRVAVVARGLRSGKRGNALQPFNRVRVSWTGRTSLYTLTGSDLDRHVWLEGDGLASGFYVLELVSRLLGEHESAPRVFAGACWTLEHLEQPQRHPADVLLRRFEKLLLEELGYGLDFARDADSGEPIDGGRDYVLVPELGFVRAGVTDSRSYPGDVLLAIDQEQFEMRGARRAARRIFREALAPLLGGRPLASRQLLHRRRSV